MEQTLSRGVFLATSILSLTISIWPSAASADPNKSPALCGSEDNPETGVQGDLAPRSGYNCGLSLLSFVPGGGAVQGAGHCAYVRPSGATPYTGDVIQAYSLADPMNPVLTDELPALGGSESIRSMVTDERAILVAGRGVYDVSNCEKLVKKGEIFWPTARAQLDLYVIATSSHEIAISHDAKRVYSGIGFFIADISNIEDPSTWTVKNWTCEMNVQTEFPASLNPETCDLFPEGDYLRQYSHSSDDNLEGTRWYGAHQGFESLEEATVRVVDISKPGEIEVLDALGGFPGHSMSWWKSPDGREFIVGANELDLGSDSCADYPRPTSVGNSLEAYIAEVTGDKLKHASLLTMAINRPENCDAANDSGVNANITEHSIYNKHGAAVLMMEYGDAGLRIFDVRDGYAPKEVAYFNSGNGHVHSGLFHYDDARGIVLAPGSNGLQVLELQPQVIRALGLPYPTDPAYPRSMPNEDAPTASTPNRKSSGGGALSGLTLLFVGLMSLALLLRPRRH